MYNSGLPLKPALPSSPFPRMEVDACPAILDHEEDEDLPEWSNDVELRPHRVGLAHCGPHVRPQLMPGLWITEIPHFV